jgi:hypothetical protein
MCKDKKRQADSALFFQNEAFPMKKEATAVETLFAPLAALPSEVEPRGPDLLVFSYNRPMQLYATLESMSRYFSNYERISILCRADDERYRKGYAEVESAFPHVHFVYQSSKSDFKPLLLQELFSSSSSPYIAFAVDDQIVTDFVDLKSCAAKLEKTAAYGFYLRLGQKITYSYQCNKEQAVPESLFLSEGLYAWNLKQGNSDWDFPHTVDMTIYRKKDLKKNFEEMKYKTPNSLEYAWARRRVPEKAIGIYFEHSKVVNTPLNIVGRTGNPHMEAYPVEELLVKFEQGLKIDIEPLYRVENHSPHIEYFPTFIPRRVDPD